MSAVTDPMHRYPHALPPSPELEEELRYLVTTLSYQNQLLADILSAVSSLIPSPGDPPPQA
jgi:hypothetical protein